MFLDPRDPRKLPWYHRHRQCFRPAAQLFHPPIEPVSFPYEYGKTLPGYFMKTAASNERRPTLLIIGGGDTTSEELYFFGGGAAAILRGYNAFLWEGPGQFGAYALDPELTYRPDWEVPTRYAVDYVLSRPDVDPGRIALSGHSFGGYLAPRAAAFEKRLKAVIAYPYMLELKYALLMLEGLDPAKPYGRDLESQVDLTEPIKRFTAIDFRQRMGASSLADMYDRLADFTLDGLETKIECPLLSVGAAGEGASLSLVFYDALIHQSFDKLTCPKTERTIQGYEGGDLHCMMNNPSLKHQIEFDWLDDVFGYRGT
jgi:hypothetical protein